MPSSISSFNLWRRFFGLFAGVAALTAGIVYAFVIMVDPFDALPLSPALNRAPVATNARFSFPALARSQRFDSALFGTSTSRLLRPAAIDPLFGTRLANLAMNDATAYEMSRLLSVFVRAHPDAKLVMVGLDRRWCVTGPDWEQLTARVFPEWMYNANPWDGYGEMYNLHAIEMAGRQFGIVTGLKPPRYGRDGYTTFVPPDGAYDPIRVAHHLAAAGPSGLEGERSGAPDSWVFPALTLLREELAKLSGATRKVLFYVPYHRNLLPPPGSELERAWTECKKRTVELAQATKNTLVVDFMIPSPITQDDNNYWDGLHYREAVAERLAQGLATASRGEASPDYRILAR